MWSLCSYAHLPNVERVEVKEETRLVDLCVKQKHTTVSQGFTKSLKDCLLSMDVGDLKGYTKEELMAFVKAEGGPNGLVPVVGWWSTG